MKKPQKISLSVTQLATFACRSGDLVPDAVWGPTAREGMRAHKNLQDARKKAEGEPDWLKAEFSVNCEYAMGDIVLQLGGRIDLVDLRDVCLSEIKTTLVPAEKLPESQRALQWSQLYLYGYIFLQQHSHSVVKHARVTEQADLVLDGFFEREANAEQPIDEIQLELIHVNLAAVTQASERRLVSAAELTEHASNALETYARWIQKIHDWRIRLETTTESLAFPFDHFRPGQRDMAAAVYRTCRDSGQLLCEAPTGIGKTISSLYPSLKSMGSASVGQLVYLTAKAAGRLSAEQAMQGLSVSGLKTTLIQIRAKELTCFCSNGRCERDEAGRCPMTIGFFDRLPAARDELLALGVIDNASLDDVAWAHQLCPFELVQQLLPWVHVVIADYNYVFDPLVKLSHFSKPRKDTILLIDEAHNLVDRSRSMFSAELSRDQCMDAIAECRQLHGLLADEFERLSQCLLDIARKSEAECTVCLEAPRAVSKRVSAALGQMSVATSHAVVSGKVTAQLWRALCRYAVIDELFADKHRCIVRTSRKGRRHQVSLVLYCVDASMALASVYKNYQASVLFSATLRPGTFYRDTLGLATDTAYMQLSSPFDPQRCLRAVVDWVDTRYQHRQASLAKLVALIYQGTSKAGNYLVFLPSYAYLDQVHELFVRTHPERQTWTQSRGQNRQEQQDLLDALSTEGHRLGFAIQGGVFGEGIDYLGDRLIGAIIVGTGLPSIDKQKELIAEHYQRVGHNGYDFAYRFPGFTRVLQTAGRVIRDESDKGFVLFVDARFKQASYRKLFPDDWQLEYPETEQFLMERLRGFWASNRPGEEQRPL